MTFCGTILWSSSINSIACPVLQESIQLTEVAVPKVQSHVTGEEEKYCQSAGQHCQCTGLRTLVF